VKPQRRKGSVAKRSARARREQSAGGVVVRHTGDEPLFLLIRDSYGHWGFPKGHLERGEPSDAAARREVMEETGLAAVELLGSIASIDWRFRFRGRLIHKHCEFFLMETLSEATRPQKSEGITACKWSTLADAQKLLAYENARAVLQRAHEMLVKRAQANAPA
jgi:8-oxo-dGTP pyrophosphatase MutT (NUDIX family)